MIKISGDCCVLELWKLESGDICADVTLFDRSIDSLMDGHGVPCVNALLYLDFEPAGIKAASFERGIPNECGLELIDKLLGSVDGCARWLDGKIEWRA